MQLDVRLDDVVLRTLQKEPARRYQQASDAKAQLDTMPARRPGRAFQGASVAAR